MHIDLYTEDDAFDALREEWDDLLARSYYNTLFLRPVWLKTWWQVFGRPGSLRLLVARGDAGRLVGVAPLFMAIVTADGADEVPTLSYERPGSQPTGGTHRALLFVGGTEVSDYLDFTIERGQAPAVYEAFYDALRAEPGWEWLDLHCLPDGSPTVENLTRLAARAGDCAVLVQEDVCPAIALPGSWDEYLSALSKKDRHELRRKMRRVEEAGAVDVIEAGDPATLGERLQEFIALHEASTPDKADFMRDPRMRAFFDRVAHIALANGWLDLSFLKLDGVTAATLFCFRYGDAVLVYNSGFDPQAWPGLSPGVALSGYRIRQAIDHGVKVFDFMQGDERYKYDLGAQDRPVRRLFIRRGAREGRDEQRSQPVE